MITKRIALYLPALFLAGICIGTIMTLVIVDKPFSSSSLIVKNNASTSTEWSAYPVSGYGVDVAYPFGWHLFFDSRITTLWSMAGAPDMLYISHQAFNSTPGDGGVFPGSYQFMRNKNEADRDAAVLAAQEDIQDVEVSSVTYNGIQWFRISGTRQSFSMVVPARTYVAIVDGSLIIAKYALAYEDAELFALFEESVQRTTISE